jgi:hypothetical protein
MEFNEICYKNNFLTNVIIRLDFVNSLDEVCEFIPNQLGNVIIKNFPLSEPKPTTIK